METNSFNLDFMQLDNIGDEYVQTTNDDLDNILLCQSGFEGMCNFKTAFTPGSVNIDSGMADTFPTNMFQTLPGHDRQQYEHNTGGFPFPQQQVDPSTIMRPNQATSLKSSPESSDMSQQQTEVQPPKPKRTRQSKKKPLTKAQEDQKREGFLERNRVAASKCRKRKQEQTTNLQEHHSRLQLENGCMAEEIKEFEAEIGRLRAILVGHHTSGGCKNQKEMEPAIAHMESTTMHGAQYAFAHDSAHDSSRHSSVNSFGTDLHGKSVTSMKNLATIPHYPSGVSLSRPNSASSNMSPATSHRKSDGSIELQVQHVSEWELKGLTNEEMARDEDYMKTYTMSRQSSHASISSKMSGIFDTSDNESQGTSIITTPEGEKPNETETRTSGRRGQPRQLGNPRTPKIFIDPVLKIEGLQGL